MVFEFMVEPMVCRITASREGETVFLWKVTLTTHDDLLDKLNTAHFECQELYKPEHYTDEQIGFGMWKMKEVFGILDEKYNLTTETIGGEWIQRQ